MIQILAFIFGLFITTATFTMLQENKDHQKDFYPIHKAILQRQESTLRSTPESKPNRSCGLFFDCLMVSPAALGKIPWRIQG